MPVDDAFTVALLHMNGTDGSTTFIDESGKSWTANGNAQIDTAQSKFDGGSGLFDGSGDYVSSADHADWRLDGGSNANTWTIDFWVMFNGDPGGATSGLITQYVDTNNYWALLNTGTNNTFQVRSAGSNLVGLNFYFNPAGSVWYHIAIVKNGTSGYMAFVNGTQVGTTQTNTNVMSDYAGELRVGQYNGGNYLNGWIDELRISKGIARWTANFTPPTAQYRPFVSGNFFSMF